MSGTAQLELLPRRTTPSIPLRDALRLVADQWSRRIGVDVRVVEEPYVGSGGYRIERAS